MEYPKRHKRPPPQREQRTPPQHRGRLIRRRLLRRHPTYKDSIVHQLRHRLRRLHLPHPVPLSPPRRRQLRSLPYLRALSNHLRFHYRNRRSSRRRIQPDQTASPRRGLLLPFLRQHLLRAIGRTRRKRLRLRGLPRQRRLNDEQRLRPEYRRFLRYGCRPTGPAYLPPGDHLRLGITWAVSPLSFCLGAVQCLYSAVD